MSERFTEILRAASEPAWSDALGHRFVKELFAGAVPDAVMARYLIQDHRFLDNFLTLLGSALASADTFEARVRLGRFIGMVAGEENTYFLRAFEALGVTEDRRTGRSRYAGDCRLQGNHARRRRNAELCRHALGPRCGRVALSGLGLPRAEAVTGQLRARRVDHAPRQSGFSRLRRFPPRGVGSDRPRAGGICAATFSDGLSPSDSPFSKPPPPTGPDTNAFDRVKAPSSEGDRETLWGGRRGNGNFVACI